MRAKNHTMQQRLQMSKVNITIASDHMSSIDNIIEVNDQLKV